MTNYPYPGRQVLFYSLIGGFGVSLLVIEANWQMLRWAEQQNGYHLSPLSTSAHLFEILLYATLTCLPLILLTVAICVAKQVYRDKRGGYIISFCATAVFLAIVIGAWLFKIITHYMEAHTFWLPPSDFASALAYIWLWFCISAVMFCAWLAGVPTGPGNTPEPE
ncbi:hypothetical protein [Neisseria iguanae]|uniref:Uncharacterized protein n=1 Tax=Neisseria iguanae TaxID=90242 RepID=A0A2P7TZ78_9NEIS|nr:hypothetical protein [Neisseria iguanae]PSJ80032.1 hypothetical protein C7N83_08720 [Neisseria iguanae]